MATVFVQPAEETGDGPGVELGVGVGLGTGVGLGAGVGLGVGVGLGADGRGRAWRRSGECRVCRADAY